ncbi:MAG: response regulator [Lachnospiraceae bacterium]|jgi:two-component system response regulator YesN|nr:response regulator [Lachnospiraceae bacterium]
MLRIMLVDDEVLVRTNIKLMLSQYADDFAVCGEASSAEEAIEQLEHLKPDVILSDMVMAGMSGVDFCKFIHANDEKTHFVALSNYDDYKLVHDTLKNGGEDYLLKHELTAERLRDTLIGMKPMGETRAAESKELSTFQEKFVLDLITHLVTNPEDIEYQLKALDLRIDSTNIIQILLRVDNYASITNENDLQRKRTINFSIINIGNEILKTYSSGILTHIDGDYYSILISFAQERSQAVIRETIQNVIRQISSNLKTYLNITSSFVVSKKSDSIDRLPVNYREAYQLMKQSFFSEAGTILFADDMNAKRSTDNAKEILGKDVEKQIVESFYVPCEDALGILAIEEVFAKLKEQKLDYKTANNVLMKLLGLFIDVCKTNAIEFSTINKSESSPFEQLAAMTTLNQAREWFLECFHTVNKLLASSYQGNSDYVRKSLIYIQTNYREPLTLDATADYIGISKSYLSTLFKEEVGQGFSEYLNVYRIKKAKMLMSHEQDLHVVAFDCGFQDYSYFFKVFKKVTGMTPAEYKKQGA